MEILKKLFVRSGQNSAIIKYDDKYLVNGGSNGFNMVVISKDGKVKYNVAFDTGQHYLENERMINFIHTKVSPSDILVIAVKKDAFHLVSSETRIVLSQYGRKDQMAF